MVVAGLKPLTLGRWVSPFTIVLPLMTIIYSAYPFLGGGGRAIRTKESQSSGLYYKHITIVHDDSIMMLQVVASPTIVNLTTLEVSFMLLANIYSRGVTHDDRHVTIVIYL